MSPWLSCQVDEWEFDSDHDINLTSAAAPRGEHYRDRHGCPGCRVRWGVPREVDATRSRNCVNGSRPAELRRPRTAHGEERRVPIRGLIAPTRHPLFCDSVAATRGSKNVRLARPRESETQ